MATRGLLLLADARLKPPLKECGGVFLADRPLVLLLSRPVWDQDGLVPGARPPTPCPRRVSPQVRKLLALPDLHKVHTLL